MFFPKKQCPKGQQNLNLMLMKFKVAVVARTSVRIGCKRTEVRATTVTLKFLTIKIEAARDIKNTEIEAFFSNLGMDV